MARRRRSQPAHDPRRTRRSLGAIPAVIVTLLLAALAAGAGLADRPPAASSETPLTTAEPTYVPTTAPGTPVAVPSPTTLHKYAEKDENAYLTSCVADAPASTVPVPIAQAFCVCTLNAYEQIYPTYDALNAALASGALSEQTRTQISQRCVQAILGG
ncbi:MAG TPA: hypothetical protein VI814_11570 [Candidatus Limnocylindria bacterium]